MEKARRAMRRALRGVKRVVLRGCVSCAAVSGRAKAVTLRWLLVVVLAGY